jgi:hypothetical protein
MARRLPTSAILLGVAGLIPFIGIGIASVSITDSVAAQRYVLALVAYGAVILAFIGGVHWGFVLHPAALPEGMDANERSDATRLGLGVLPSLIGFGALLMPLLGVPEVGLGVLIIGYLATIITETRIGRTGAVPGGYLRLRMVLSFFVLLVLTIVLVLRLIGAKVFF